MIEYITEFKFNSALGLALYWFPLVFCAYGYLVRTHKNYWLDVKKREEEEGKERGGWYSPTDTIGTLIGRGIITTIPVANLYAALFDLAPEVFGRFFKLLSEFFDQPLVPKRKP